MIDIILFVVVAATSLAVGGIFPTANAAAIALGAVTYCTGSCVILKHYSLLSKQTKGHLWYRIIFGMFAVGSICSALLFAVVCIGGMS